MRIEKLLTSILIYRPIMLFTSASKIILDILPRFHHALGKLRLGFRPVSLRSVDLRYKAMLVHLHRFVDLLVLQSTLKRIYVQVLEPGSGTFHLSVQSSTTLIDARRKGTLLQAL